MDNNSPDYASILNLHKCTHLSLSANGAIYLKYKKEIDAARRHKRRKTNSKKNSSKKK